MAEVSAFRGVLNFFWDLGVYDVLLPFLLVFSIMFAILDKTKVLGTEKVGSDTYPKKSINAMVAFVVAFFVVGSAQLVELITKLSSQVFILLLLIVLFIMLVGTFHEPNEKGFWLDPKAYPVYVQGLMALCMIAIVAIFLNAVGWLDPVYGFLKDHWSNELVASGILLLTIIGVMLFVTSSPKAEKK